MPGGNAGSKTQVKLKGDIISLPVAASTVIYRDTLVCTDATGGLVQASDTSGLRFAGVAEEGADNSSGALGALSVRVRRTGIFRLYKYSVNAATDVGTVLYAKAAQTSSVDETVAAAANSTYRIPIGVCTQVEAVVGTSHYVWVSIQPNQGSLLNTSDISTLQANTSQTGIYQSGIIPQLTTSSSATPTISAANFITGIVTLTYAGGVAFTLPTSGIVAGTICKFVKDSSTAGELTITGGTLTGSQTASNVFYGCANVGDSVDILCVTDNTYVVIGVSQKPTPLSKTATATLTAAEVASQPIVDAVHASVAIAITLPAAAAGNAGSTVLVGMGGAATVTVVCAAGFGGGGSGHDTVTLAQGDMCACKSDGTNWYVTNVTTSA